MCVCPLQAFRIQRRAIWRFRIKMLTNKNTINRNVIDFVTKSLRTELIVFHTNSSVKSREID